MSDRLSDTEPTASAMTFEEYADVVLAMARYPRLGNNLTYPALGLAGETGEVHEAVIDTVIGLVSHAAALSAHVGRTVEHVKKVERDSGGVVSPERAERIKKELGDVLWYVAALAKEAGTSIQEVAEANIEKLTGRRARGTIQGEGDAR